MYKYKLLQFEHVLPDSKLNPEARSGHRMVADEAGDLYSFGGYNQSVDERQLSQEPEWHKHKPLFQELWKYTWRTNKWRKIRTTGDIPDKLVSHCMYYCNGKIIIYGGTSYPYGDNCSNKLTVYHIAKNHWEVIEPLSDPSRAPAEMYGQACTCDEQRGEIYVVGGTNGHYYSLDVHKFNLCTKKWTVLYKTTFDIAHEPGCRYRHEIAFYNNKLYLFGGGLHRDHTYDMKNLPVFDLETCDWTFCKTQPYTHPTCKGRSFYPKDRKCHSLAVVGSDCYICGGINTIEVCKDVWHINLEELKWTRLVVSIPYPVFFHGSAISFDSKLTVFGGVEDIRLQSRNNKLTTIWLKIPTLKSICLSAVSYYANQSIITTKAIRTTGLFKFDEADDTVD